MLLRTCYTLYCERIDCEHSVSITAFYPSTELPTLTAGKSAVIAKARKEGWVIRHNGSCICPACVKLYGLRKRKKYGKV